MSVSKTPSGMFNVYDEGDEPPRGSKTLLSDGLNNNAIAADRLFTEHNTADGTHKSNIIDGVHLKSTCVDGLTIEKDSSTQKLRVKDGGITAAKLAANAVETAKIKDLNVTAAKLAANAVETDKIKDLSVTSAKIANGAITAGKILGSGTGKAIDNYSIGLNNNNELEIKDGGVTSTKLGFREYVALLYQTGTNNPTAYVLTNTLGGTVTWVRLASGLYKGVLSGAFTANKTCVIATLPYNSDSPGTIQASRYDSDSIYVVTRREDWLSYDSMLIYASIMIRVYP